MATLTDFRLEIGPNKFFDVLGNITITADNGQGGETASCMIKLRNGQQPPAIGSFVSIALDGHKQFGGRLLTDPIKYDAGGTKLGLNFANYLGLLQRKLISDYDRQDTIGGHLSQGLKLGNAYDGISTKSVAGIDLSGIDEVKRFSFNEGTADAFVAALCAQFDLNYTLEDQGAVSLGSITTPAKLTLRPNSSIVSPTPIPHIAIINGKIVPCAAQILGEFTESVICPTCSVITLFGKNGKNLRNKTHPTDADLTKTDTLVYRAEDMRTQYPVLETADRVTQISVLLPDMTTKILNRVPYDPDNPIPAMGSNNAALRPEEHSYYVNPMDVPGDSIITVTHITGYIYVRQVFPQAVNFFKQAEQNTTNGEVEFVITDESIVDITSANAKVAAAGAMMCRVGTSVTFKTRVKGWKYGQQLSYLGSLGLKKLTVRNVVRTLMPGNITETQVTANDVTVMTNAQITRKVLNFVNTQPKERLIQIATS